MGDETGDLSLWDVAKEYIRRKYDKPGEVYLGVVHRLDRPVSGVVCFARTSKAAARLSEQFRGRSVEKHYLAIVESAPTADSGHLVDWLSKDESSNHTRTVSPHHPDGKKSSLTYTVLARFENRARNRPAAVVHLEPETGRGHQLRVQLASRGWPILGDVKYGAKQGLETVIGLHARTLRWQHPTLKTRMETTAAIPLWWNDWLPGEIVCRISQWCPPESP